MSRGLGSPWWSRVAIACVVAMSVLVVWLQSRQAAQTESELTRWRDLREARLDLAKGFLHATRAGVSGGAYSAEQGRVWINQGIARLQAGMAGNPVATAEFTAQARNFNARFELWKKSPGDPGSSAELRAAFHALESAAESMDTKLQTGLENLTERNRREFLGAIGIALALLGLLCMVLLVVQRARVCAERELAERERRFRRMTEELPQLIWTCDETGACDYVSRRWLDYTGMDAASQLGDGWLARINADDRKYFMEVAREAMARGDGFQLHVRIRGLNDDERWFDTRVLPLPDAEGRIVQWLGSCTDVQRDRELREVAEAERNFSDAMIDSLPGVFYLYDTQGKFMRWNRNFARVAGYSDDEIAGMHPLDFFTGDDRPRVEARIADVFATGKSEVEAEFVAKDGVRTPYFFTGLTTEVGGKPCLVGVGIDITLRKAAENEVRALNETLEQRVARRTAELQAKNRELETFTYSVSHDLKAPLRGIDGYSRLLLEDYADRLDDEGRRFLGSVRQASVQMGQLIDDLLSYSQLERRAMTTTAIPLKSVLDSLPIGYEDEARAQGAVLKIDLPDVVVQADAHGLAVVMRNLLDNALKFSRKSAPPTIEVGGRVEGAKAVVWVRDNGIGFEMKFVERIFDIFQRLHRAEDYPGTGIGLAIVRKAMERMNGRVWAESTLGRGSTFYLEIPLQP